MYCLTENSIDFGLLGVPEAMALPSPFTPRRVDKGSSKVVFVTHIEDPDTFYCQLDEDTDHIVEMAAYLLKNFGENRNQPALTDIRLGQACVAQFSGDENWYRAEIIGLKQSGNAEVRFVDYGNTEEVPISTLKNLPKDLLPIPLLSLRCSLDSVVTQNSYWSTEEIQKFQELVGKHDTLLAKFLKVRETGQYMVDLTASTGEDICKVFCTATGATYLGEGLIPSQGKVEPKTTEPAGFMTRTYDMGERVSGTIVYCKSPEEFWFLPSDAQPKLDHVMELLAAEYTSIGPQERVLTIHAPGTRCAAKYPVDQSWYRGIIKSADRANCEVEFVDYGNTDAVPLEDVRELIPELASIPVLAVKCGLSNAFPQDRKWSEDDCAAFEHMAIEQEAEIIIREERQTMCLVRARAKSTNVDFGEEMIRKGLASAKRSANLAGARSFMASCPVASVPLQKKDKVYLSHVESPEKFWVQLARDSDNLETLFQQLQEFYKGPENFKLTVETPEEGKTLVAQFSQDQAWYRAVVEKIEQGYVQVRFLDYGNTDRLALSSLREIAPKFLRQSALALKCALKPEQWKPSANELLEEMTAKGATCFFLSTQGDYNVVELQVGEQDVATQLAQSRAGKASIGAAAVVSPFPGSLKLGKAMENVFLSHVESPSKFWCQLAKHYKSIEALADTLAAFYSSGEMAKLADMRSGVPCVALYPVDGCYYRAVVESVQDKTVSVHFVDYGNTEQVSKDLVYSITQELLGEPVMSVHCQLDLSTQGQSGFLTESLQNLAEKELSLKVLSEGKDGYVVDLFDDGQSVTTALQALASGSKSLGAGDAPVLQYSSQAMSYPRSSLPREQFVCFMTHVVSGEEIYVQLSGIEEELARLNAALEETYSSGSQPPLALPKPGLPCCLYCEEFSSWHRAEVLQVMGDQLQVQLVDYGNIITVPSQEVKPLAEEFLSAPYAFECSLGKADLDKEKLEDLLAEEINCHVISGKKVRMVVGGEDVLVQLQKSLFAPPGSRFKYSEVPSGEVECMLSHVESSGEICFQMLSSSEEIIKLQEELNITYTSSPPVTLETPEVDGVSCVLFQLDESWYRARIDQINGNKVTVNFVDFGNSEVISRSEVKGLLNQFLPPPCFAYRCKLANAPKWKPKVQERLENLSQQELKVQFITTSPPYEVVAKTSEGLVSDLIRDILPKEYSQRPAPRNVVSAVVTDIEPDGLFYIQLTQEEADMNNLVGEVQQLYAAFDTQETDQEVLFEPGATCVARFSADGCWYRALIKSVSGDSVFVLFVDYGNSETVSRSDIRPHVEERYLKVPPYAYACRLQGVTNWTGEHHRKFTAHAENNVVNVKFLSNTSPFEVHVEITKSVLDLLEKETTPVPPSVEPSGPPAPVASIGEEKSAYPQQLAPDAGDCYISEVSPDGSFYLQMSVDGERLEGLSEQLAVLEMAPDHSKALPPSLLGCSLGAKFSEDGSWYRCTVTEEDPTTDTFSVLFVDFGNMDKGLDRTRLKPLPEDCLALPPMAYHCCFASKGRMSPEEGANFKVHCEDQMLQLKSAAQTEGGLYEVVLELDGVDVLEAVFGAAAASADSTSAANACDANNSSVVSETMASPTAAVQEEGEQPVEPDESSHDDPAAAEVPSDNSILTLTPGHRVEAIVTYVDSPGVFFVTVCSASHIQDAMKASLHSTCVNHTEVPAVEMGSLATALYTDGSWYRVRVDEVDGDTCTVTYIDHGNVGTVALAELRALPEEWSLDAVPALAICCSLAGVEPSGEEWSEEEYGAFANMVLGKKVLVEVLNQDSEGGEDYFLVSLLDLGNDIGLQLLQQGLCQPSPVAGNTAVRQVFSDSSLEDSTTRAQAAEEDNEDAHFVDAEEGEEDGAGDVDGYAEVEKDTAEEVLEADGNGDMKKESTDRAEQEDGGEEKANREEQSAGEEEIEEPAEDAELELQGQAEAAEAASLAEADQQRDDVEESDQSQSTSSEAVSFHPLSSISVENVGNARPMEPSQRVDGDTPVSTSQTSLLNQALTESVMLTALEGQEQREEEKGEQREQVSEGEKEGLGDVLQLDETSVADATAAVTMSQVIPEVSFSLQDPLMESTFAGDQEATPQTRAETSRMDLLQVPQEELKEDKDVFESYSKFKSQESQNGSEYSWESAAERNQNGTNCMDNSSPKDDLDADVVGGLDETEAPEDLLLLDDYDVIITHTESCQPQKFWVMLKSRISNYELLQHDLQEYVEKESPQLETLPPTSRCLALRDKKWLRADFIGSMKSQEYKMRFVDVGGETLVREREIKPLPKPLQMVKPFAICCYLSNISTSQQWSDEAMEFFIDFLKNDHLVMRAMSYNSQTDMYGVDLFQADQNQELSLSDQMLALGHAVPCCSLEVEGDQDELEKSFMEVSQHKIDSLGFSEEETENGCSEGDRGTVVSRLQSPGMCVVGLGTGEGQVGGLEAATLADHFDRLNISGSDNIKSAQSPNGRQSSRCSGPWGSNIARIISAQIESTVDEGKEESDREETDGAALRQGVGSTGRLPFARMGIGKGLIQASRLQFQGSQSNGTLVEESQGQSKSVATRSGVKGLVGDGEIGTWDVNGSCMRNNFPASLDDASNGSVELVRACHPEDDLSSGTALALEDEESVEEFYSPRSASPQGSDERFSGIHSDD